MAAQRSSGSASAVAERPTRRGAPGAPREAWPPASGALGQPATYLSLEWLLYGIAIILAAALRLGLAASDPLAVAETATALAALDLTLGRPAGSGSPLADVLAALVFFIAGPSDLAARLPAAVAGTATVAILPLFRPLLGRLAALISAFLLAVGPFSLAVSQRAEGDALALLAALVVVLGVFRFQREEPMHEEHTVTLVDVLGVFRFQREERLGWLLTAIVALGVLLPAGPRAITFLLAAAVAIAVARFLGLATPLSALPAVWRADGGRWNGPLGWAVLAALVVFAVVSTRLFLVPSGLALPALNAWVREFSNGGGFALPLVALLAYDPLVFGFGLAGIVWLIAGRPREPRDRDVLGFVAIWSGVALLVAMLGGQRFIGPLAGIAVPLTLLAGTVLADALRAIRREDVGRGAALLGAVPLLVYGYVQSAVLLRADDSTAIRWLAVLLSVLLAAGYTVLVAFALGRSGLPVVGLGAAGLLLLGSLHASFELNARPTAAEWVLPDVPGPAATIVPDVIADLQAARGGVFALGVDPTLREPFAWYLRDQPGLRITEGVAPGMLAAVVPPGVSVEGATAVRGVYAAGSYGPPTSLRDLWRWYVWRTGADTGFRREAVLLRR